ncbi:MAG: metallophosphoesterase family protein [Oscillospiraceae bacterium]|nr:metallophosphoesterase family protein [Oscillospiraceae bacterium]
MSTFSRLSEVYKRSMEIPFDNSSKFVFFSDCHRGDGSLADDFNRNQNIFYSALKHYYANEFTYFDLGDSDELWKNKKFSKISTTHSDTFRLIREFYNAGRFFMIYGNHDILKRSPLYIKKNFAQIYDPHIDRHEPLFDDIKAHEGLIIKHKETGVKLFLVHGHQGDLVADIFWKVGSFLTRNVWRRFESFGLRDPTSAAINYAVLKKVERKFIEWIEKNNQPIICGHTHRPSCPSEDAPPYFNDGSCIYNNSITCLEIVNSEITLIKWDIKTNPDRAFYVDREVIAVPRRIETF